MRTSGGSKVKIGDRAIRIREAISIGSADDGNNGHMLRHGGNTNGSN